MTITSERSIAELYEMYREMENGGHLKCEHVDQEAGISPGFPAQQVISEVTGDGFGPLIYTRFVIDAKMITELLPNIAALLEYAHMVGARDALRTLDKETEDA